MRISDWSSDVCSSDLTHRKRGREDEREFVDERWQPVFLEEDLDHVGDHLAQSEWPDAIRTVAVLPKTEQATFKADHPGPDHHRHQQNKDHLAAGDPRTEKRLVGKECVSTCEHQGSP